MNNNANSYANNQAFLQIGNGNTDNNNSISNNNMNNISNDEEETTTISSSSISSNITSLQRGINIYLFLKKLILSFFPS